MAANQKARAVMGNKFIEKLKAKRVEKHVDVHLNAYSSLEMMPPDDGARVNKLMREMREDAFKKLGEAAFYCPRDETAIHEAGHAVVAYVEGCVLDKIALAKKLVLGREQWEGLTEHVSGIGLKEGESFTLTPDTPIREHIKYFRNTIAGRMAEHVFVKDRGRAGSSIDEIILAKGTASNIGRLTGVDAKEVFDRETDAVESILRAHEPAVRAISAYLMVHEVMPAEEILSRIEGSDR
jgi:hypothetical protein